MGRFNRVLGRSETSVNVLNVRNPNLCRMSYRADTFDMALTESDAISLAQDELKRRGWAWIEPVKVHDRGTTLEMHIAADVLGGGSCSLVIEKATDKVLSANRHLR